MMEDISMMVWQSPDGMIALDRDGIIRFANPAIAAMTGFSREELLNQSVSFLYDEGGDKIRADYELEMAFRKGRFVSEGWRMQKGGGAFWTEMVITPLFDRSGELLGYTCTFHDVSGRKQEELRLRESEERFRLMVESVRDYAIFLMDSKGHILTWNEGAQRTKGYAPDEIIGRHFSTFYISEDLESRKPERELQIAEATGKYEEEGWRVKKDGALFWANVVITALFSDKNQLIGFSKVTRDLTERRRNEELMRQSEERYRSLVEQVTDYGIFMMDDKGRITSWNEGAKRISGYLPSEIIGKYFSVFYPEEDIMNGKPALELKVAKAEGKYEEEGWRLRKDGSHFWASVVITAVYNTDGTLIGYSKVTRDLTEKKAAERALKATNERLRMLAEELKLANAQLSYANQELEQFTSIVSHDLQEPIRTIKSFLQLIDMKLNAQQADDLKKYIGKTISAADRMRELIQNLLHYSQLSKGDMVLERVNVADMVSQALQNLKTSIDNKEAVITVSSEVETVEGDRVQLVQLVQNLVSNALKFTRATVPEVAIRCSSVNNHVQFAVTDNGIGIASNELNKVFEIFRRLDSARDYPGTGIGLAICKKIVDRHRGRIWPESEPGKGTTFYFTINEEAQQQPSVFYEKI